MLQPSDNLVFNYLSAAIYAMHDRWTQLAEWIFGGREAATGEGVESVLDYVAPWANWLTLVLFIAATAMVVYAYMKERGNDVRLGQRGIPLIAVKGGLITARLSLVAIILFMLYEFALLPYRTELPDLAVLLDISESMDQAIEHDDPKLAQQLSHRLADAGFDEMTRLNLAKTLLLEHNARFLSELRRRYRLRLYLIGSQSRLHGGELEQIETSIRELLPSDKHSRLGKCLQKVLSTQRGRPTAAIVTLTDGITTEGKTIADLAPLASRRRVPLLIVGLGSETPTRDLRLSELLVDPVVFVEDIVVFEAQITGTGFEGSTAELQLRRKGQEQVLAKQNVTIGADGQAQSVRLRYQLTEEGEYEFELALLPLDGESSTENNRQSRLVSVRNDKIKVLLVQAYPNYEFRYLKNMLSRHESTIQLTTVLQDADPDYTSLEKTAQRVFPVQRDELFEYDVILFGDVNPTFLTNSVLDHVVDFAKEKGGGILFMAGPKYTPVAYRDTPLASLMPVALDSVTVPSPDETLVESFAVRPTDLGMVTSPMQLGSEPTESLQIWRDLPSLYWLLECHDLKPGARVLAEHPTRRSHNGHPLPVICMQFVGAGKVIMHSTDETWRWRYRVGDIFFSRYWVQTIRYLSRSKLWGQNRSLEISTDRRRYPKGDPVRIRASFLDDRLAPAADDGVTVVMEHALGKTRRLTLNRRPGNRGVFEITVNQPDEGAYHLWIAAPTVEGQAPSADFSISPAPGETTITKLDAVDLQQAAEQSGGSYYTLGTASDLLKNLPPGRQVKVESLHRNTIWNSWKIALAFVVIIISEWTIRKKVGMV